MNPEPIPVSTDPLPAPVAPTVHRSNKRLILILACVLLIIIALFVTPLPYYQTEEFACKQGSLNCPQIGWNLAKPLYRSILESFQYSNRSQMTPAPTPSQANPPLAENPTTDPTANWNTYVNETIGVSLKYPSISNGSVLKVFSSETNKLSFAISISIAPEPEQYFDVALLKDTSVEDWYKKAYGEAQQEQMTPPELATGPIVGGLPSKQATFNLEVVGKSTFMFVQKGNDVLQIVTPSANNQTQLQIVSTFKFTDTAATSTKTISSSKYGYRVKIPSDWNQLAGPPEDESLFNFRKGDYDISLSVIPTTAKTIQSYLEQADQDAQTSWEGQPSIRVISTKLTKINNLSAVRREEEWLAAGFQKPVINTYFLNQSILSFTLKYLGSDPNPAITETAAYDQVLSSLLFF